MAKITILPNGINGGLGGGGNSSPPKRGNCNGWSIGAARRNQRFLQSVISADLPEGAFAYTLTVKEIPSSAAELANLVHRLRKYIYRNGGTADHWVIEWTGKGRPHLHGVVFFDDPAKIFPLARLENHWLKMTKHLKTSALGQHVVMMDNAVGWFQYMSKHASRGMAHYQREQGSLPAEWQKTGRMWGKGGDWPISETSFELNKQSYFRVRRMCKSYQLAEARTELAKALPYRDTDQIRAAKRRILYLRKSLKRNERTVSEVRGINEWVPEPVLITMLVHLMANDERSVKPWVDQPKRVYQADFVRAR